MLKDGVTPAELAGGLSYIQQLHTQRTNDTALSMMLAENLFVGRTMQFQADLEQKIKALTPTVVDSAVRKHLDPKQLSIVTAGDFKK